MWNGWISYMLLLFFIIYRRIYCSGIFLKVYFKFCNEFVFTHSQFSDRNTAVFRLSLSCSSSLQWNSMWSTVCSALCRSTLGCLGFCVCANIIWWYRVLLPCPVTTWCYRVLLPYPITMSCYRALLPFDFTVSCYHLMLPCPVTVSCYHLMLPCPVTIW
jgi:hypothetical protein